MAARQFFRVISSLKLGQNVFLRKSRCGQQGELSCVSTRLIHSSLPLLKKEEKEVTITIQYHNEVFTLKGKVGDSVHDVVYDHALDLGEYGACGGSMHCSTCHVVMDKEYFEKLPKPSDGELSLLKITDLRCDTSRLSCQIFLSEEIDGIRLTVPTSKRDLRENPGQTADDLDLSYEK